MQALRFVPQPDADAARESLTPRGKLFQAIYGRLLHAILAVYDLVDRFRSR